MSSYHTILPNVTLVVKRLEPGDVDEQVKQDDDQDLPRVHVFATQQP
jgi:hypothetical protein